VAPVPATSVSAATAAPVALHPGICADAQGGASYTKESVRTADSFLSADPMIPSAMEGVATASFSGSPPTGYFAVKNSIKSANAIYNLHNGGSVPLVDTRNNGSFFSPGDSRENICEVKVDMLNKIVSCSSFNMKTMTCACCGHFMSRFGVRAKKAERAVVILSDHAFPAAAPAGGGGGGCLKIFRCESASLRTITDTFLAATAGWQLAAGSVMLLSSVSHLASVGVSIYVDNFFECAKKLKHATGIDVRPAPIILMSGTNDPLLVRSLVDLAAWQKHYHCGDNLFASDAISAAVAAMAAHGTGVCQARHDCRYSLPFNIKANEQVSWLSDNLSMLPSGVGPIAADTEQKIIAELISHYNLALVMDLDPSPNLTRMVVAGNFSASSTTFVIVGNSHAARTGAAIRTAGFNTIDATFPACRITTANSEAICARVAAAIALVPAHHKICVLCQIFDNALYFCRGEDGSMTPAAKLTDGRHHVPGDSILAPKETQFLAFKQLLPVFNLAKGHCLVIVPPLPRYWDKGCCGDKTHLSVGHLSGRP